MYPWEKIPLNFTLEGKYTMINALGQTSTIKHEAFHIFNQLIKEAVWSIGSSEKYFQSK